MNRCVQDACSSKKDAAASLRRASSILRMRSAIQRQTSFEPDVFIESAFFAQFLCAAVQIISRIGSASGDRDSLIERRFCDSGRSASPTVVPAPCHVFATAALRQNKDSTETLPIRA
jgi:hypothetical protein